MSASIWINQSSTTEAFERGWFRTGDLAMQDHEGYVNLVGRLKDIIIRGGENISAAEVEAALGSHPQVAEVAVIGFPHPRLGEQVGAIIRLHRSGVTTASEILEYAATKLTAMKVAVEIRFSEAPLLRNAAGKLDKQAIRRQYAGDPAAG